MPHRVLCIESDAPTRDLVRRLLEESGFAVEESETGLDGIARARTLPPDLVLAATRLTDMEGAEVAARLREDGALAQVPLVAVGREAAEHDVALASGCDGFISRPLDEAHFAEEVRSFLAGKRERLPAEAEARARERLAGLDRRRSLFLHDLAHELSTPLTPLAGYLKILLSERLGPLAPQQRKVLDGMASAASKLSRIVENISDFASLESGHAPLAPTPVDPDALAEDVARELRGAARDARLHVEVRPSGAGAVMADGRKLRRAVANVMQNAVKFSPHGGEVLLEVTRVGDRLRFAIYDQGPGVPAVEQERIFEPFRHTFRPDETRPPGSGLGLPVARRIIEAHGGRLLVESPPHSQPSAGVHHFTGSKFLLEIPAVPVAASPPALVSG
jgi:signal transduction histidine kinase